MTQAHEFQDEASDDSSELAKYRADMAAEREAERIAENEIARREWAQRNGNDSGFDPYWNL